jgi:membrane protease YdiL (CAAX protease family)
VQTLFLVLLLAAIFSFLVPAVRNRSRALLKSRPAFVWAVPILLTAIFCAAAGVAGAMSATLALAMLAYTAAPVACAWFANRPSPATGQPRPAGSAADFLAILSFWLPLEFGLGAAFIPRSAQGFLHSVAYGVAILLGLVVFLCYRGIKGMKYNLPLGARDSWLPLAGFALSAPVLIGIGMAINFIPPPHLPTASAGRMAAAVGIIFVGTGLPEEILFRSLIQNLIVERWGAGFRTLLLASVIFGCAHLDNGPQALPNWRYAILAAIAGFAYGKVFEKSGTVLSGAALHMMVDWMKHFFF